MLYPVTILFFTAKESVKAEPVPDCNANASGDEAVTEADKKSVNMQQHAKAWAQKIHRDSQLSVSCV